MWLQAITTSTHRCLSRHLRGSSKALVSNGSGSWQDLPSPHCPVTCGFSTKQDCLPACLFVHSSDISRAPTRAPERQPGCVQPGACPLERRRKIEIVIRWKQEGHERRTETGSAMAVPGGETSLPAGGWKWRQDLNFYPLDQLSSRRQVGFFVQAETFPGRNLPPALCNLLSGCLGPLTLGLEGARFPGGFWDRTLGFFFSCASHLN